MFLGEYQHSLDAKGRVILPARFRDQLEGGAVMARGLDGCLDVYPPAEFQSRAAEVNEARKRGPRERQAARSFFSGAGPAVPDGQGRVAIPPHLREYAGLDREVVGAGALARIEVRGASGDRGRGD